MGLVPGDDYDEGGAAPFCFDADNPVGWQQPPTNIRAVVAGVISCGPPYPSPDGTYLLTPFQANSWRFRDATWTLLYTIYRLVGINTVSEFAITHTAFGGSVFDADQNACDVSFANKYTIADCLLGKFGHDGTAICSWGPGIDP